MPENKRTVLRSFRLSEEHDRLLEEEARRKGISVNALLANLITKYGEWDRFAERFGVVTLGRQGFRSIFDLMSEEQLTAHGKQVGQESAPDFVRFWFGKLDLGTFLSFLKLFSKYSGAFHYETAVSGHTYTITIHHELGPKYNVVLANYMDQAIRKIVGAAPRLEVGSNSLNVSFEEPYA